MFNNIRNFLIYRKIIKRNKELLKQKHDLNIDWVWRLYKTYSIPLYEQDNIKQYGPSYVEQLVKKEVHNIDETFMKLQLSELIGFMEAKPVSRIDIGLAFRYKYVDTSKTASKIIWTVNLILFGAIGFLISSYIGMVTGLVIWLILYIIGRLIKQ